MGGNLFSGTFFTLYCHFNFLKSLFVLGGYVPSSALSTVLLVVLEHAGIVLAAVISTVSICFTISAFPSHTPPAYSTKVCRTHIVGECEIYKEERDALEEEMGELDVCNIEEFGRLESSEKTIAILGDR